jgi:hypothetical protein
VLGLQRPRCPRKRPAGSAGLDDRASIIGP